MNKEEIIVNYMNSLQITREEATQLWEDDQEDFIGDDGEEMTAKAKEVKRYEKTSETKEKTKREVKKDAEKVGIIQTLHEFLLSEDGENFNNPTIVNEQKEITFIFNDNEYSISLIKHRKPKAK